MAGKKCFTFNMIGCLDPKNNGNGDSIFMKVLDDQGHEARYPDIGTFMDHMKDGDTTPPLNIPFSFQETLFIELFDQSSFGDDSLGSLTYTPGFLPPQMMVTGSESTYEFYIKDIRDC